MKLHVLLDHVELNANICGWVVGQVWQANKIDYQTPVRR